jgi:hypothetical protein
MDLASSHLLATIGEEVPIVPEGKNFDWESPIRRIPSFDVTSLIEEIDFLKKDNKTLRCSLARKYQHCNKLKEEIRHLNRLVRSLNDDVLCSQSGVATTNSEPGLTVSESAPMAAEQITAFADQDAGWTTAIHGMDDVTRDSVEAGKSQLGEFLSRPIRQSVQAWPVNQPLFYQFNPWKEFLENPFVQDKIKNFELIRLKLHCKMVISGTKFHYGRSLVSYNPLSGFDQITVQRNFLSQDLIQASQKPHFFLNPTKNTGGELCMPFFWNKNYLSLSDEDYNDMGEITIKSFGNLLHANGGNDPVTVTIYLWAEDVVLTMPTRIVPLVSQAGKKNQLSQKNKGNSITASDEYGSGIISKPAALVAKAAGVLSELPLIRPYALATQMVAGKVGEVAKIFGYSRPSIVSDIQLFKPNPTGNLTNVDAGDAVHKLTLDSKAEITIDSRVSGLDGTDQMGILDIAQRESYLTQFTWSPDAGPDTLLWNCRVTPMLFDILNSEIHPTPMSMLAQCFDRWTGSVKFRFQIVKSDFHKGRILVRYDPNNFDAAVEYNTNYSRVVDIAEEDDFEIVVGWAQAQAWLQCGTLSDTTVNFSDSLRLALTQDLVNGILEIDVLNDLVCPSVDSPISINVFVSMCEDAKFAAPSNVKLNDFHVFPEQTPLPSQSGMLDGTENPSNAMTDRPTGSSTLQTIAAENQEADQTYAVWYGDPPTTIRELCKRYVLTRYWFTNAPPNGIMRISKLLNKDAPYQSGWDPNGIDVSDVDGVTPLSVVEKDYSSWWSPCYAGVRGARRKKYLFSNGSSSAPSVARAEYNATGNGVLTDLNLDYATSAARMTKWASSRAVPNSGAGSSATNLEVNNTVEVELPFYAPERFRAARLVQAQSLPSNSHVVATFSRTNNPTTQEVGNDSFRTEYQQWDAVGEDFSLLFFTGAPILYNYVVREFS